MAGSPALRVEMDDLEPWRTCAESAFATELAGVPTPTPQPRELGRRLGPQVAKQLVPDLQGMGSRRCRLRANRRRGSAEEQGWI